MLCTKLVLFEFFFRSAEYSGSEQVNFFKPVTRRN